jgi:hypothetical protein
MQSPKLHIDKIGRFMPSLWAERGKLDGHVAAGYSPKNFFKGDAADVT